MIDGEAGYIRRARAARIEARLREPVSDAIERAPAVATWASGRLALGRLLPVERPVRAAADTWDETASPRHRDSLADWQRAEVLAQLDALGIGFGGAR